jgi:ADP-ribose pyrophosphatase
MPPSTRRADYRRYRELLVERPDLFAEEGDGIAILTDETEIRAAERHIARRNRGLGLPPASASVGVLAEDVYILALRDAVRFPDGSLGTHNRVVYRAPQGIGVLALLDGNIVLVRIYRHPVRRWLLEIPRGSVEPGHSLEETVHREVAEEVGGSVTRLVHLGRSTSDTSLCTGVLDLYFAELSGVGIPQLSEGIGAIEAVSPAGFEDLLRRGEMEDGHAIAAFTQARLRRLV